MDVSHSVYNSVYDTRSGFSLNRINFVVIPRLLKSSTLASSGVKEIVFPTKMLALLWKILFLIKLFYLFYNILFYFVIPMTLCLGILLRFNVVIEPVIPCFKL